MRLRTVTTTTTSSKNQPVPRVIGDYLALPYRLEITQREHGSFVVRYPDLPGCVTQVERLDDAVTTAREILAGWLEIALEDGQDIPLPRQTEHYSGKFIVRIARSLHRDLAETAHQEGVSLNAYVGQILAAGQGATAVHRRLDELCEKLGVLHDRVPATFGTVPGPVSPDDRLLSADVP